MTCTHKRKKTLILALLFGNMHQKLFSATKQRKSCKRVKAKASIHPILKSWN